MSTTKTSSPTIALKNICNTIAWADANKDFKNSKSPILVISNNKKDYNYLIENEYNAEQISESKIRRNALLTPLYDNVIYNIVIWNYPSKSIIEDESLFDDILYEISEITSQTAYIFISTQKHLSRPWDILTGTNKTITYLL